MKIAKFLLLTFAITWALWALVLRTASAAADPSRAPFFLALGGPVFLIGVFAPGIAALTLTAFDGGAPAVNALLSRITRVQAAPSLYAFAFLLIPLTKLAAAAVQRAITRTWPPFGDESVVVMLLAIIPSTFIQAGEELGWRGYLLPRLTERIGLAGASVLVGVIWAAWHLPLFFMPGADTNGQSFPLYLLAVTAFSVVLGWLYWRSGGSLFLTMFAHAAYNNLKNIVTTGGMQSSTSLTFDGTLMFRVSVLLLWIVAAGLIFRMRGVKSAFESALQSAL